MKNNNCETVMKCFKDILQICGEKPQRLNTDRGGEIICKKFKDFLKQEKIWHYVSYSLRKCPIIERFNLTIQNLLYRILAKNRSYKWVDYLPQAMSIYLNRKHRTINMSPVEAELKENHPIVRKEFLKKYGKSVKKKIKPKFKSGDTVRIWKKRLTFDRGYSEENSTEYFTITHVLKNLPVPRYLLKDSENEKIEGAFFQDELVKYNPSEWYDIAVIDQKKVGNKEKYLVHYVNYPKKFDKWVTKKELKQL